MAILILSSHLRLGLPKRLFPLGFPIHILKAHLPDYIRWTVQTMKSLILFIIICMNIPICLYIGACIMWQVRRLSYLKSLILGLERGPPSLERAIELLIWLRKSTLLDLTVRNGNHIIPSYCHLPVSCRNLGDRCVSLGSCKPQI